LFFRFSQITANGPVYALFRSLFCACGGAGKDNAYMRWRTSWLAVKTSLDTGCFQGFISDQVREFLRDGR